MITSIIPNPLHPAIVHLPMAIVVLLPLVAVGAIIAIRRGANMRASWGAAVAGFALLAGSAWASLASGDPAKDQVERIVAEAPIETHEEAAEAFLALAVGALAIAALGVRKDRMGQVARVSAALGTVALIGAGFNVGHSGGQLVYKYGAGGAFAAQNGGANGAATALPIGGGAKESVRAGDRDRDGDER